MIDPLTLPFDQYQRYTAVAQVAEKLGHHLGRPGLRVLDVGGFFRTRRGVGILPLTHFLPRDRVLAVDLVAEAPAGAGAGAGYLLASGLALPFADGAFDLVASCDTLEHVPAAGRRAFVDELLRVAAHCLVLAAPFDQDATAEAERILYEYSSAQGMHNRQLEEHMARGLPSASALRAQIAERGLAAIEFPDGYLPHWLAMMLIKHTPGQSLEFHLALDRFYNRHFSPHDRREPAYRRTFIIARQGDESLLATINAGRPAPFPRTGFAADMDRVLSHSRAMAPSHRQIRARDAEEIVWGNEPPARVLLVAPMPIDRQRMGPAIRYWEIARILSHQQGVTLLVPNDDHPEHPDFAVRTASQEPLDDLLATHQVIVVQGPALQQHPALRAALAEGRHCLVADLYDPITLEQLAIEPRGERGRWLRREYTALLNEQLRLGDFFICASERQRDYWLGALAALGRLNGDTWDGGDFRALIDVVPFGLPPEPPRPSGPVLKGTVPGIAPGDRLILWGGGLWDWLDPATPVRAMEKVAARHPRARLVFFDAPRLRMAAAEQTRQLAADLGLLGHQVLFTGWLPPEKWGDCLLEADVGLSFHPASAETRLAFRTRLLDYIWAGLPIATAGGDVLSEIVAEHGLGYVVTPGDVSGLADALSALLDEVDARGARRAAFREVAGRFTWERVARPLLDYCRQPRRARDTGRAIPDEGLLSELARARREQVEAETARQAADERAKALARRLAESEARFQAAMDGRVMRLMTGIQRALRGRPRNEDRG
ncbi:MAG: glycosyltransferase [Anaerolineae bacterium]|jgi:glycosyltransferase involved in cell wall biosynthesis